MMRREDCVLVMVDIQEKLLPVIANKEKMVENIVRLVKFSNIVKMPVILTEQQKLGSTIPEIKKELSDLHPISKICFDCFLCDEFAEKVNKIGKKTLIVCGIEAHICVTQTVLHALPHFCVHIVEDAISSRTIENWKIAVARMSRSGAVITSTEMIMYELLQKAGTDEFKATLQLVK